MKKTSIGIIGCGWLGMPLATILIKNNNANIIGTTTNNEKISALNAHKIDAVSLVIDDNSIICDNINKLLACETVVINFPPKRISNIERIYLNQNKELLNTLDKSKNLKNIVFISSTSVYPEDIKDCTESLSDLIPDKPSGKALLKSEQLYQNSGFNCTVLRLSGLIGYKRNPARFLAGKKNIKNAHAPVNLVHRDDCIQIIIKVIMENIWNKVYNVCSDIHPLRRDYYMHAANLFRYDPPQFDSGKLVEANIVQYKIINNSKFKSEHNYQYIYPDPLEYITKLVQGLIIEDE